MSADPFDQHIGFQLRKIRIDKGVSLVFLAGKLGVTYQQIRKYEIGQDRISAANLYRLAKALNVSPQIFFDKIDSSNQPIKK